LTIGRWFGNPYELNQEQFDAAVALLKEQCPFVR
jgi:hypothetical protein